MVSLTIAFAGLGLILIASFFETTKRLHLVEYFALAIAAGLALVVLLVGGLTFFDVPLTRFNLSIVLLGLVGASIVRLWGKRSQIQRKQTFFRNQDLTENIFPLMLFLVLIVLRLLQIRDIFVPNSYDGFLYTSLLQEYLEKSSIPSANIFQSGFHALALMVHAFWNLTPPEAILLTGQWLSAVCGLSFYVFARRYIHNVYAAGLSSVVYACLLLFPTSLISWGHYSFLMGLVLLPLAILNSMDWITGKSRCWATLLFVLSLTLTHVGFLLIWSSFVLVYAINRVISIILLRRKARPSGEETFLRPLLLISPALILVLFRAFQPLRYDLLRTNLLSPMLDAELGVGTQYVFRLFRTHDSFFIVLGICLILWSLVRKRDQLSVTLYWPLAIWFFTWIQYRVLRHSLLTYVDLILLLSLPLALCIGLLAQQLFPFLVKVDSFDDRPMPRRLTKSRVSLMLIICALVGISYSPLNLDSRRVLFTSEDVLAMQWINDNTPNNSGFLIRNITMYNNTLIPSDGGGWIPLLTGRYTIIPQLGELNDICEFAAAHGVNYIYFGKQTGNEGFDLRLSDLDVATYNVVYGNPAVEIVSLRCP